MTLSARPCASQICLNLLVFASGAVVNVSADVLHLALEPLHLNREQALRDSPLSRSHLAIVVIYRGLV